MTQVVVDESTESGDWQAVADAINARLKELDWNQADLVERSEPSDLTIRDLQLARRTVYRKGTLRSVSSALGWTPDSIGRISRGLEPIVVGDPKDADKPVALDKEIIQRLNEQDARLARLEELWNRNAPQERP